MQGNSRSDLLLFGSAVILGLTGKMFVGWHAPFWLDETYTGVIASQPDFASLIDWCRHELSGPLYYVLAWLWEKLAGSSDAALRLLSLAFSFAAIAVIWLKGSDDPKVRLIWAALMACWYHGLFYATQARPQALLLLLATVQTIFFVRSYRTSSTRDVAVWAAIGSLMLLTHLHTAILTALQGATLAWIARAEWRRLLPAALAFVPAGAWLALQLPFVLTFAQPQNSWYPLLEISDIGYIAQHLLGGRLITAVSVVAVAFTLMQPVVRAAMRDGDNRRLKAEAVLLILALAATFFVFFLGTIRPSYDGRYLVPFAPAALLGLAYVIRQSTLWRSALPAVVVATFALICALTLYFYRSVDLQRNLFPLQFQSASNWLMEQKSRHAIFVWDNQVAAINSDMRLREIGGFFFARAGYRMHIDVGRTGADSQKLLAFSNAQRADIIWIGGTNYPKGLLNASQLKCRRWGDPHTSQSIACKRKD